MQTWLLDVEATPMPLSAYKLARRIARLAWKSGEYFESLATIAAECRISRRNAIRARDRLVDLELISETHRGGRDQWGSSRFRMVFNGARECADREELATLMASIESRRAPLRSDRLALRKKLRGDNGDRQGCQDGTSGVTTLAPYSGEDERNSEPGVPPLGSGDALQGGEDADAIGRAIDASLQSAAPAKPGVRPCDPAPRREEVSRG